MLKKVKNMKVNRKTLELILVLALATSLTMRLNVEKAHADFITLSLTSPANNAHSMDMTPDFMFLPVSNVTLTQINCTLYVKDIASGDIEATNNTETTITCNRTLTVSADPYEWYINATDADETVKSEVRNVYVVPSTGPMDIPDDYEELPDSDQEDMSPALRIAGIVAIIAIVLVVSTVFGFRKQFSKKHVRRR